MGLSALFVGQFLIASAIFNWEYKGVYESTQNWEQTYDFIVVGGGSGGATVASRLSENPNFKVLLLESGGSGNFYTDIPYLWTSWLKDTPISWFLPTVPQQHACKA